MPESSHENQIVSQMRKGLLELCILLILQKGECHTSDIIGKLSEAQMQVVEGSIYPLLGRLKSDGYLNYRWSESNLGPPRKYYFLTDSGELRLQNLLRAWQQISSTVSFLNSNRI